MRHQKHGRKLGRTRDQRKALLKTLAVSLVSKEKIKTTEAKAKELRPYVERLVTYAKKETVAGRRAILAHVGKVQSEKLATVLAPRYKDRKGGYTRITKLPPRKTDGSPMAVIEFVK